MAEAEKRDDYSRDIGFSLSVAMLATLLLYISIDIAMAAGHARVAALPATVGFVLLGGTLLTGGTALLLHAAIALGRRLPRAIMRALGAAVVTWYPARWLAEVITSGSGISRSGWAPVVRICVVAMLVIAAGAAAGMLPVANARVSRQARILIGGSIAALGLVALAMTSVYATTYIRAYRGVLVISALLLQIGIAFAIRQRGRARSSWRRLVAPAILAGVAVSGFGLSRMGGSQRTFATYTIFAHTLVTQKVQPIILQLSPVFHATARVNLDATRLGRDNPVPVPALPRGRYRGHNVLFVTFDALRADISSTTLAGRDVAPNLRALAAAGISFPNAIANYSHTSRSLLSILAASWQVKFPSEKDTSSDPADVRARTRLPRLLRGAGYESVAIMMSGRWGEVFFDKERLPGFDRHIAAGEHCEDQVAAFQKYLAERTDSRPFWAWVHVFDTHTPFASGERDLLFGTSEAARYAAAVHHGDRCLGDLIAALQRTNQWSDTIVVVSADHGEGLGEHGRTLQHSTCYWHDIHVPLVIRLPDVSTPASINYPIQTSDLVPTLANLLAINVDEPEIDGDDLSGLLDPATAQPARDESFAAMAFTQGHPLQYRCASVVAGQWHLIYTDAARTYELYDLDTDPREEQNLAAERPDVIDALRPVLDSFRDRASKPSKQ